MNSEALEATIAACEPLQRPEHAALVTLCRWLAGEMDRHPNARLSACYLSALKDVHRVVSTAKPAPVKTSKLQLLQAEREAAKLRAVS